MRFVARPRGAVAAITIALGTQALDEVTGRIMPCLPCSTIRGGRLGAGVEVISKSDAFGAPTSWRTLLSDNQSIFERLAICPIRILPSPWAIPPGSARRPSSRHSEELRPRIEAVACGCWSSAAAQR